MNDLINRQDVIDALDGAYEHWSISELYNQGIRTGLRQAKRIILSLPSAQNRGKWKTAYLGHTAMGVRSKILYCSECNRCMAYPTNYCPDCGAEMQKGEQEDG